MRRQQVFKGCLELSYQDYHPLLKPLFQNCVFLVLRFLIFVLGSFYEMKVLFDLLCLYLFLIDDKEREKLLILIYLTPILKPKHVFIIISDIYDFFWEL